MDITKELMEKLGKAWYYHKELIKKAEKVERAVDYLKEEGIILNDKK